MVRGPDSWPGWWLLRWSEDSATATENLLHSLQSPSPSPVQPLKSFWLQTSTIFAVLGSILEQYASHATHLGLGFDEPPLRKCFLGACIDENLEGGSDKFSCMLQDYKLLPFEEHGGRVKPGLRQCAKVTEKSWRHSHENVSANWPSVKCLCEIIIMPEHFLNSLSLTIEYIATRKRTGDPHIWQISFY